MVSRSGHQKRNARGGNPKKLKDKSASRRKHKEADGRRAEALEEARKAQRKLEARIAREKVQPAMGAAPGALFHRVPDPEPEPEPEPVVEVRIVPPPRPPKPAFTPYDGDPGDGAIGKARQLVRQGYNARKAMRMTGVGFRWIEDLVDTDGWMKEE